MERNISIIDIIKKISNLNSGSYTKDGMAIKINESKEIDKYTLTAAEVSISDKNFICNCIISQRLPYKTKVEYFDKKDNFSLTLYPFSENFDVTLKIRENDVYYNLTKNSIYINIVRHIYCYIIFSLQI